VIRVPQSGRRSEVRQPGRASTPTRRECATPRNERGRDEVATHAATTVCPERASSRNERRVVAAPRLRASASVLACVAGGSIALATAFSSCTDPNFARRSLVSSPRILAIVAEPPEINPGQLTVLHAITGGAAETATFRWFVCARAEATATFTAQSTFGVADDDEGCFGDAAVQLGPTFEGHDYIFTVPTNLFDNIAALRAIYGQSISLESLMRIVNVAGIPVTIAVEMRDPSGTVQRAIKRVIVSGRPDTNHNPPPPSFRFGVRADGGMGGVHVSAVDGDPERCAADSRAALTVHTNQVVQVAPDANTSDWLETYTTLDSSGDIQTTTEVAYYSFYATTGIWDDDRTRIPIQNTIWHAPAMPGTTTMWIVVRDGRGGTSGCRFDVNVTPTTR
jgi:hypothetical protein